MTSLMKSSPTSIVCRRPLISSPAGGEVPFLCLMKSHSVWQRDKEEHHGFPFLAGSAKTVWQLARAPGAPNTAFLPTKGAAAADATTEWSPDPQSRERTALATRVHHSLTEVR